MTTGSILIVDDNTAMCDNMADILSESRFEPFFAHTCDEGLKLAQHLKPHIALLDLKLPDGLGTELLAKLKQMDPDCVCIIITAFADVDSAMAALEKGAFHYLHKPVRPTELLQLLNRALEMIRLRDEKRCTEAALRKSEAKYRSLVENLNVGIYRSSGDSHGSIIQANRAMAKIFGFDSMEEFMAASRSDCFGEPEDRTCFLEYLRQNGSAKEKELRCRKKDGTPIWVACSAIVQYGPNKEIAWIDGVVEDVSDRKKLEEQLRHAQKMEAVGILAGGIAHDFNNILTAIVGFANLTQIKMAPEDPLNKYLDNIISYSGKAARLTRDLLTFSRKQIIELRPLNINDTIRNMESLLHRFIGDDIQLRTVLADEDVGIMADDAQIEQVVMNIVINARCAMPDGGLLTIETRSMYLDGEYIKAHGYGEPGKYILISIADTGVGMDTKTRERIFEPFFTTKEVGKGTGLGLSIVYGIVKQHNGYINVYSEPGGGTSFRIYIPAVHTLTENRRHAAQEELRGGNETVLLAEDDAGVRQFEKDLLEEFGYRVIEAVDGAEAVALFRLHREEIQLLVLDVVMPRKNGKEAHSEITALEPHIRTLFTSGYTGDILSRKGILEEGLNFCPKPVSAREFLLKVRQALDK